MMKPYSNPLNERAETLEWRIYDSLDKSYISEFDRTKEDLYNVPNPFKNAKEVCILNCSSGEPLITVKKEFKTIGDILKTIEEYMDKPIVLKDHDQISNLYSYIGGFFCPDERLKYIKMFENGKLKPKKILGTHIYFDRLYLEDNMIRYNTGS